MPNDLGGCFNLHRQNDRLAPGGDRDRRTRRGYRALWVSRPRQARRGGKAAKDGLVSRVELAAAESELKVLKDRAAALEAANFQFQRQLQEAEALAGQQAQELETYESTVDAVVEPRSS
jgi:hypothetical protein